MVHSDSITALFEQGGGLSGTLSHFELRAGQIELVKAIEKAVSNNQHLVAEAGTGIGKTFSYLLPTLGANKKVFVSTATKHLQEQIFFKDLPTIEAVLGRKVSACLLKGRSNYFCHYRFHEFFQSSMSLNRKLARKASIIRDWSEKTLSGDLSEIAEFTADDAGLQKRITSTMENCLSNECPYFEECFVQKVREKAKQSEVVIVNHALLMADIVLKETGFAEILPEVDVVVIDEAHHLPKIATQAFAEQITGGQLLELARDARHVYKQDAGDMPGFDNATDYLVEAIQDFTDALADAQSDGQIQLGELKQLPNAYAAFQRVMQAFKPLLEDLQQLAERSSDLTHINARALAMAARIKHIFTPPQNTESTEKTNSDESSDNTDNPAAEQPEKLGQKNNNMASVALLEWGEGYFRASRLPIHLDNRFRQVMHYYADSWLFVSATLAVSESFHFFLNALGLPYDIPTLVVDSPFDYPNNAVIHVPPSLPAPNHQGFIAALVDEVRPILEKTRGRAFMLFTSYRNLHEAAKCMTDSGFNLFVQGQLPKSQLIDAFIKADNAVLLGTVSFWEGVDVDGERLCCVVIDKIPFPSPADPIIAEQSRYLESQGKSAFALCYLPQAATLLKQGAGRLIRSQRDKGVLIFGDTRLIHKGYGKQLLKAMPPASRVQREELMAFIDQQL